MREGIIQIIIGARKMGKTTLTRKMLAPCVRVLYVMTIDHERYRDCKMLHSAEQLKALEPGPGKAEWTGHIRIVCSNTRAVFEAINKYVWNTKIVYEDASKYIPVNPPDDIINGIYDSRMKGNDIVFQYHLYGKVPPDIFANADYVTIFKNRGKYDYDKVPDYLYTVIERVRRAPHKEGEYIQYNETIEMD